MVQAPMTSENRSWRSVAHLLGADPAAAVALVGAPLAEKSLTPGRCDLAPGRVRATLPRVSTYDVTTGVDIGAMSVFDSGDIDLKLVDPAAALAPIVERCAPLMQRHALTVVLGGNNAVTRPAVHALDASLQRVGLLTLDAHFDLRDTDGGLNNGNPVQALLDDGLPGARIAQVGLAPFANTRRMHEKAKTAGIHVATLAECAAKGFSVCVGAALDLLAARCDVIHADFDIDVIDRAHLPGAPGARPGGAAPNDFFAATRLVAAHPKVRSVDLTEFDPSLDVADISALTAARWLAEILAGVAAR